MLRDLEGMTGDTGEESEEMNAADAEEVGVAICHLLIDVGREPCRGALRILA